MLQMKYACRRPRRSADATLRRLACSKWPEFAGTGENSWSVSPQTVHFDAAQYVTAFVDEDPGAGILWSKHVVSQDVDSRTRFGITMNLKVDAGAAARASPRRDFGFLKLINKCLCLGNTPRQHLMRQVIFRRGQRAALWEFAHICFVHHLTPGFVRVCRVSLPEASFPLGQTRAGRPGSLRRSYPV